MKIILNILNAKHDAHSPQEIGPQISFALTEAENIFHSMHYWGKHGTKRKSIKNLSNLSDVIKKMKSGIYVLSDAEKGEGYSDLYVSFRNEIISFQLFRDSGWENLNEEIKNLVKYYSLLYSNLHEAIEFPLVSSISLPEVEYAQRRPPKRWRVFDPWGIVDFIKPSQIDFPDAEKITHSLCHGDLPKGVFRQAIDDDMVMVDWSGLALEDHAIDKKLSTRSIWYHENSAFENDSSFNELGDIKVEIFENKKTREFTFYDVISKTGYKAIGFDQKSSTYEIDKIKNLQKLLQSQKTSDGLPLLKVYIIVNMREFALHLRQIVLDHHLSGVIFSDEAGQLWNPFPDGLWLN